MHLEPRRRVWWLQMLSSPAPLIPQLDLTIRGTTSRCGGEGKEEGIRKGTEEMGEKRPRNKFLELNDIRTAIMQYGSLQRFSAAEKLVEDVVWVTK